MTCKAKNCGIQYVGQTSKKLKVRFSQHSCSIKNNQKYKTYLYQHFRNTGHTLRDVVIQPVEKVIYDDNSSVCVKNSIRHIRELEWIKQLQTPFPLGLNDNIYQKCNISRNPDMDVFTILNIRKRKSRSHGARKNRNIKRFFKRNIDLVTLDSLLKSSGRHRMLSLLSSLSLRDLKKVADQADSIIIRSNPLYTTASLVDCYSRHILRPHVDDELNHRRYFLKISFLNKGMEFINLPSILSNKNVVSKIPNYFKNQEKPMICYKYNTPIRGFIFNYNKTISSISDASNSCSCTDSPFNYSPIGHVITGDLNIISDENLRKIIRKGPKYRLPVDINFDECRTNIAESLKEFALNWCKREHTESHALNSWLKQIIQVVDNRISFYSQNVSLLPNKSNYSIRNLKQDLHEIHKKYVLVPADKAANNIIVV